MACRRSPALCRPPHPLAAALVAAFATHAQAAGSVAAEALSASLSAPRADVIGSEANLPLLGGSANRVSAEELRDSKVFTTAEALRRVPGVNVRDEEGFGLRPTSASVDSTRRARPR
jgi:Fe(3+) dicitrate transport protein